jgi:hypothetical protein
MLGDPCLKKRPFKTLRAPNQLVFSLTSCLSDAIRTTFWQDAVSVKVTQASDQLLKPSGFFSRIDELRARKQCTTEKIIEIQEAVCQKHASWNMLGVASEDRFDPYIVEGNLLPGFCIHTIIHITTRRNI